jgi:hypothetical protein
MGEKPRRVVRQMECPEGKGKATLLLQWQVQRGKKALQGICCDNPRLTAYGGEDCGWQCWEKISRLKNK